MRKITFLVAVALLIVGGVLYFVFLTEQQNYSQTPLRNFTGKETYGPGERLRHDYLMMRDPAINRVPTERLMAARQKLYELRQVNRTENTQALVWQERGPNNVGGRTRALLVDANDPTGNTVYAGGVGGGLWKTTNFKTSATWTVVDDFFSNNAITCIKQNPTNPLEMFFGTGEGWGNIDAIDGLGIWKTTNGGNSWTQLASTATISYINDLEFDLNGYIYAATRATNVNLRGVLRSADGGANWVQVLTDPNAAITTRAADLERAANGDIYASLGIFSLGHLFRSPAAGVNTGIPGSWVEITPPGITSNGYQRIEIAVSPNQPARIYVVAQNDAAPNGIGAMYRSDDNGTNWTTLANASWCDQGASTNTDFSRGQAWYDLIMAVDPGNSNTVLTGGVVVVRSTNSGTSWSQITRWTTTATCTSAPVIHADIHEIVFLNSNELIICTDGGIYYSTDGGTSYTSKNNGYNVTQYYGLAVHPTSASNVMLGGTQDNGSHLFSAAGLNAVSSVTGGDGGACFIDETNGTVWMTSNPGGFFNVYRNSGTYLGTAGSGDGRFVSVGDYADVLNVLYYGDANGVYGRVFNVESGSASFSTVNFSTEMGANRQVSCIRVDPNDETTIWMGCSDAESNAGAPVVPNLLKVIRANNDNTGPMSSRPAATAFAGPALPAGAFISSIDIEAGNSNHMLLTVSNYGVNSIWESSDGGVNWTSVEGNLPDMPVRSGLFIPAGYTARSEAIGGVAIATELGVWTASNLNAGSTNWIANNNGLANVRADQIVIRQSDKLLAVGTHGRGVFTTQLLNAPLPVTLQNFAGQWQQGRALLEWVTSSEVNSDFFELEKSSNGIDYHGIAKVQAAGFSTAERKYSYHDPEKPVYKNYYRLRSVDLDGASKLSPVVILVFKESSADLFVLANPFETTLNVRLFRPPGGMGHISLFDMQGKLIMRQRVAPGQQSISMDLRRHLLARGSYVLKAWIDGREHSAIVQKQ